MGIGNRKPGDELTLRECYAERDDHDVLSFEHCLRKHCINSSSCGGWDDPPSISRHLTLTTNKHSILSMLYIHVSTIREPQLSGGRHLVKMPLLKVLMMIELRRRSVLLEVRPSQLRPSRQT